MRQILLDSTGLYNAELAMRKIAKKHEDTSGLHKFEYDALFNIVSAIVLWDEVVIFDEEFCSRSLKSLAFFNEYENLFKKADNVCLVHENNKIDEYIKEKNDEWGKDNKPEEIKELRKLLGKRWIEDGVWNFNPNSLEARRTLSYFLTANKNNMDYLPSAERLIILQAYNFEYFFLRQEALSKVDIELKKYYDRVNGHFRVKHIEYSVPILIDYLLDKYLAEDIIKAAFDLREKNTLVKFRREMEEIERAYNCRDFEKVDTYFVQLEEMIKRISGEIPTQRKINITISLPPALSFDVDVPKKRLINSVFLKDLTFYGIHERERQRHEKTSESRGLH